MIKRKQLIFFFIVLITLSVLWLNSTHHLQELDLGFLKLTHLQFKWDHGITLKGVFLKDFGIEFQAQETQILWNPRSLLQKNIDSVKVTNPVLYFSFPKSSEKSKKNTQASEFPDLKALSLPLQIKNLEIENLSLTNQNIQLSLKSSLHTTAILLHEFHANIQDHELLLQNLSCTMTSGLSIAMDNLLFKSEVADASLDRLSHFVLFDNLKDGNFGSLHIHSLHINPKESRTSSSPPQGKETSSFVFPKEFPLGHFSFQIDQIQSSLDSLGIHNFHGKIEKNQAKISLSVKESSSLTHGIQIQDLCFYPSNQQLNGKILFQQFSKKRQLKDWDFKLNLHGEIDLNLSPNHEQSQGILHSQVQLQNSKSATVHIDANTTYQGHSVETSIDRLDLFFPDYQTKLHLPFSLRISKIQTSPVLEFLNMKQADLFIQNQNIKIRELKAVAPLLSEKNLQANLIFNGISSDFLSIETMSMNLNQHHFFFASSEENKTVDLNLEIKKADIFYKRWFNLDAHPHKHSEAQIDIQTADSPAEQKLYHSVSGLSGTRKTTAINSGSASKLSEQWYELKDISTPEKIQIADVNIHTHFQTKNLQTNISVHKIKSPVANLENASTRLDLESKIPLLELNSDTLADINSKIDINLNHLSTKAGNWTSAHINTMQKKSTLSGAYLLSDYQFSHSNLPQISGNFQIDSQKISGTTTLSKALILPRDYLSLLFSLPNSTKETQTTSTNFLNLEWFVTTKDQLIEIQDPYAHLFVQPQVEIKDESVTAVLRILEGDINLMQKKLMIEEQGTLRFQKDFFTNSSSFEAMDITSNITDSLNALWNENHGQKNDKLSLLEGIEVNLKLKMAHNQDTYHLHLKGTYPEIEMTAKSEKGESRQGEFLEVLGAILFPKEPQAQKEFDSTSFLLETASSYATGFFDEYFDQHLKNHGLKLKTNYIPDQSKGFSLEKKLTDKLSFEFSHSQEERGSQIQSQKLNYELKNGGSLYLQSETFGGSEENQNSFGIQKRIRF